MSDGENLAATDADAQETTEILRFRISERHLHWAIAVPFMICYATALVLVTVYNPDPTRPFRAAFSWVHRLSGIALCVGPILMLLRHRHDFAVHFGNTRVAWRWRLDDIRWLLLMGPATVNKRIALPHQEKFNAAEKINFMMLTATWPIYIVTGLLIWMPGVAYLSWIVHLSMAAAATPLIAGHIFMATVNPDTRVGLSGMITGYVDPHWAHHHYRHWFDETFPHLNHAHSTAAVPAALTGRQPTIGREVQAPLTADQPAADVAVMEMQSEAALADAQAEAATAADAAPTGVAVLLFEVPADAEDDDAIDQPGAHLPAFLRSTSAGEPVQGAA